VATTAIGQAGRRRHEPAAGSRLGGGIWWQQEEVVSSGLGGRLGAATIKQACGLGSGEWTRRWQQQEEGVAGCAAASSSRKGQARRRCRQWKGGEKLGSTAMAARACGRTRVRRRLEETVSSKLGGGLITKRACGLRGGEWTKEEGMAGSVAASSSRKGQARWRRRQWKQGEQLGSTAMDGPVGGSRLGGGIWWRPAKETVSSGLGGG
jgi:hypothetical protein